MRHVPERAHAIRCIEEALRLIDDHGFGTVAAPHLDHGLRALEAEAAAVAALSGATLSPPS